MHITAADRGAALRAQRAITARPTVAQACIETDDGDELIVTGMVYPLIPARRIGPPEAWTEAEGGEVEILAIVDAAGLEVDASGLSDRELRRLEELLVDAAEENRLDAATDAAETRAEAARDASFLVGGTQ